MQNKVARFGDHVGTIQVQIGPQLLDVFSEQLYSSPNKAFEELVSNSWDAGANAVYVRFPDLEDEAVLGSEAGSDLEQAIWVLDDGLSMDQDGLQELWTIAYSYKRAKPRVKDRSPIGKFGVGKLATYLLANNIVYFCKASDGIIRCVEVDYKALVADSPQRLTSNEPKLLDVLTLDEEQLAEILKGYRSGEEILAHIAGGVRQPTEELVRQEDEFGGGPLPAPEPSSTWTLVLLTSLKEPGLRLQAGRIRWMLRASLPLSPVMTITMNGELLLSSKVDKQIDRIWQIGAELEVDEVAVPRLNEDEYDRYSILPYEVPYPHMCIDEIGERITGYVQLYEDKISSGKSELEGSSHGFFINILGRVINLNENYFGLKNLSHGAWSRFRATIRADWLDHHLSVNREGLQETPEVKVFRAFLLAIFNKVRGEYDRNIKASLPNAGEILTQHYGSLPLKPLRRIVSEGLRSGLGVPPYISIQPGVERAKLAAEWEKVVAANPSQVVGDVVIEKLGPDMQLVTYSPDAQVVYVNEEHPFSREHATTREQKELLRDAALADLMTYAFMSDIGISDSDVQQILDYKDETLRLLAKLRHRTAAQLAELLRECTGHVKGLEKALDEAFDHLGFIVHPLAKTGEPEGIAVAPLTPSPADLARRDEADMVRSYAFTYDAKSTTKKKASTGNVHTAGLSRHKDDFGAEYSLVVAPDFQEGALAKECETLGITPMRTDDLANLLVGVATSGAMDYEEFATLFQLHDPGEVSEWVVRFVGQLRRENAFGLDMFFATLARLKFRGPDSISADIISREGQELTEGDWPQKKDIIALVSGLQTLLPSMIRVENNRDIVMDASPPQLRNAILEQLAELPEQFILKLGQEH